MGLQVSRRVCRVRAQTTAESQSSAKPVWQLGAIFCALARQGSARSSRDLIDGPCAYVHRDSTEAPSGIGDRFSERKERHRDRPLERPRAKLLKRAFLGGYAVFNVGFELEQVRTYIREQ